MEKLWKLVRRRDPRRPPFQKESSGKTKILGRKNSIPMAVQNGDLLFWNRPSAEEAERDSAARCGVFDIKALDAASKALNTASRKSVPQTAKSAKPALAICKPSNAFHCRSRHHSIDGHAPDESSRPACRDTRASYNFHVGLCIMLEMSKANNSHTLNAKEWDALIAAASDTSKEADYQI